MMNRVVMECGHAANSVWGGLPVCAICAPDQKAYTVGKLPDLTGREARCSCGRTVPSSTDLAFFEFRGEGARVARLTCKHCRYYEGAHENKRPEQTLICDNFESHGAYEYDLFYCGCRGWD